MSQDLPEEFASILRNAETSVDILSNIAQVAIYTYASDATSAIRNGCVLLSVAPAPPEANSDGFLFLLGLPKGTPVNGYLSLKFRE